MKKYLITFSLFFSSMFCAGQKITNDFLKTFQQEEAVSFHKEKILGLSAYNYALPIIEKLEFRTETNEFDWKKQEYLLRVSPNSLRNIKTQRQFQETVRYMTEKELEVATGEAIRKRYDLLIDAIYLKKILAVKNTQKILLQDKVTLMERSVSLPDFEIIELIEAEEEAQKNLREILDISNSILTTETTIQRTIKNASEIKISAENLISIADIKNNLASMDRSIFDQHPKIEVQSAKLYNRMLEYEWEASKSKFSIGYIQAKYGYDSEDSFGKSFSVGIGFEIPLKNKGRLDLNEIQLNILESKSEVRSIRNQLRERKIALQQNLSNLIRKYELVAKQLELGRSEYALSEYQKIAETPPKALLRLRENTIKLALLLQELEYEIVQSYIEYMDHAGLLIQRPLKNYLRKDLAKL